MLVGRWGDVPVKCSEQQTGSFNLPEVFLRRETAKPLIYRPQLGVGGRALSKLERTSELVAPLKSVHLPGLTVVMIVNDDNGD